jgi:dienelactone hydrolase
MKYFILFIFSVSGFQHSFCQNQYHNISSKRAITSADYARWPSVEGAAMSNDGSYVMHYVRFGSVFATNLIKLVIQSTKSNWSLEIEHASDALFTPDSRLLIFTKSKDTLGLIVLGTSRMEFIPNVNSFKISKGKENIWLAFQFNDDNNELVLRNLKTNKEKYFVSAKYYEFSNDGKNLVLLTETKKDSIKQDLKWVNLNNDNVKSIWSNEMNEKWGLISKVVIDKKKPQLAFLVIANSKKSSLVKRNDCRTIWHYKIGEDKPHLLINNQIDSIDTGFIIDNIQSFSNDGKKLFFYIKEDDYPKARLNAVKLNVWSYCDTTLQSYQLRNLAPKSYKAVICIDDHRIIRLEKKGEIIRSPPLNDAIGLVTTSNKAGAEVDVSELHWNSLLQQPTYLISTIDGSRQLFNINEDGAAGNKELSPRGKYIMFYDGNQMDYFSYEISTGITRNITRGIHTNWTIYKNDHVNSKNITYGSAGWTDDDAWILIYDQFDIWKIDPSALKPAINLTNGFGRKNNIVFRLALSVLNKQIENNPKLILSAFNRSNKENGFYSKAIDKNGDPELLSMGSFVYYVPEYFLGVAPIKALNANTYLVKRMSSTESPNYFTTTNFKNFKRISNVFPEKKYNWLSSELHFFKNSEGDSINGILYKPENFDPHIKYPVIIHYYEKKSNGLNIYLKPEFSNGDLNIPWFVSNGYLVFEPDIDIKIGEGGESALNVIESAGKYLSQMSFVNSSKIGIQGFSYGGFETNYIVTHTNMFAAACSSAGICDLVSAYGSLIGEGSSQNGFYEKGQPRMAGTLWEIPELYIKNSPIFNADKVTTPLLMMHTTDDSAVPFSQAIEFFTALRRLKKRVWLLEYNEGNHGVQGASAEDFSIRIGQFFDTYLKGAPPPKWMIYGVPAKLKGVEDRFDLDSNERLP